MKILYIEDKSEDVDTLRKKLSTVAGLVALVPMSFEQGLRFFKDYGNGNKLLEFDLILLDVMNDADDAMVFGGQVLKAIIDNPKLDSVPVCLFSNQVISRDDFVRGLPKFKITGGHFQTFKGFTGDELWEVFAEIVKLGRIGSQKVI